MQAYRHVREAALERTTLSLLDDRRRRTSRPQHSERPHQDRRQGHPGRRDSFGHTLFHFNSFTESKKFSEVVKEARKLGYTEPDPRDDLSGMDVARKLVISPGKWAVSSSSRKSRVENLVPEDSTRKRRRMSSPASQARCKMSCAGSAAQKKDELLRYVGVVDKDGKASVTLRAYPRSHPFANLNGTDNIVAFKTERYFDQPISRSDGKSATPSRPFGRNARVSRLRKSAWPATQTVLSSTFSEAAFGGPK